MYCEYDLYQMGGKPVFAVPSHSRSARLAGISRYQPVSPKRLVYRFIMHKLIFAGADKALSKRVNNPVVNHADFDFQSFVEFIECKLGIANLSASVFWPPQIERGRVYVHLFDSKDQPVGFAKVSFGEKDDAALSNEASRLQAFAESGLRTFRVPRVIDFQPATNEHHAILLLEPIPLDAKPLKADPASFPARCVGEIHGTQRPLGSVVRDSLSWWNCFQKQHDTLNPEFINELTHAQVDQSPCCQIHGDFGIPNIVKRPNGEIWVFDWEECCQTGPALTDEVSFFWSVHRPKSNAERKVFLSRFKEYFLSGANPQRRLDVMLALAFYSTVNAKRANVIISHWNQL